jgi:hypothetical protein
MQVDLMVQAWNEFPEERPSFECICTHLRALPDAVLGAGVVSSGAIELGSFESRA